MRTVKLTVVLFSAALLMVQSTPAVAEDGPGGFGLFGTLWKEYQKIQKARGRNQEEKEKKLAEEAVEKERHQQEYQDKVEQHPVQTSSSPGEWIKKNFDDAKGIASIPQECVGELRAYCSFTRTPGAEIKEYAEPILVGSLGANDLRLGDHTEPINGIKVAIAKGDKESYVIILTGQYLVLFHAPTVARPRRSMDVIPRNDDPVISYLLK